MIIDELNFDNYSDQLEEKYTEIDMGQESIDWMSNFEENRLAERALELFEALFADFLSQRYGTKWIKYLSESGNLSTTAQSIRNRVEYAFIANWLRNNTSHGWDTILRAGATRLRKLHSKGLLENDDWILSAANLSGSDWNKSIKEIEGEEVDDGPQIDCPVCGNKGTMNDINENIKEFLTTYTH